MSTSDTSRHIAQVIGAAADRVHAFAADPANLASWAAGLAEGEIRQDGDTLRVRAPFGEVTVRFVPQNPYGVLDHTVTMPNGDEVLNPLRVLPHPDGAEIVMTVRRRGMSDAEFDRDCAAVAADLDRLRALLEQ